MGEQMGRERVREWVRLLLPPSRCWGEARGGAHGVTGLVCEILGTWHCRPSFWEHFPPCVDKKISFRFYS